MDTNRETAFDASIPASGSPSFISPAQLRSLQGRADAPLILDARRPAAFSASKRLIAGARHVPPERVAAFAQAHRPAQAVAYCVYGHGVGAQAARDMRSAGWQALALAGGIEGGEDGVDDAAQCAAWRTTPPLTVLKRPDLGVTGDAAAAPSRWITRERPKVDRVACPWLIRRFIDARAEFLYVPPEHVFDEAKRLNAVPYDIAGAAISHDGDRCSFDTLLAAFDLRDTALDMLALIVRGADTDRLELAPQSAGLLAVSLGLSRLHGDDDHAMLAAAMPVYDALYAWCSGGTGERHAWAAQPGVAASR